MAYTAIESMRKRNEQRFGTDLGPMQPPLYVNAAQPNDLKSSALRFLHERCEGLLFEPAVEEEEARTGIYQGRSISAHQIPYNMEKDIDRLCLEKSLEAFIDSGTAEDAYTVYFCYLEMYLSRYGKSKRMVELLSEYESNGSSLLMTHRDHYSHSVYVFALGLAVYETNESFRTQYKAYYNLSGADESAAANHFLEYWGLTALFHDIGYPFELPFEQVLSYFEVENQERGKGSLYLSYRNVESLTELDEKARDHFENLYGKRFQTTSELFAHDIAQKLGTAYGFSEEYLLDILNTKPTEPSRFLYHMDHAFFSATRLYRELVEQLGVRLLTPAHVDALSAILMHNSLYKFSIAFFKDKDVKKRRPPMKVRQHPLGWLLALCDELQCWDRTAYGRNTRTELYPMAVDFDFSGNAISAVYYYDQEEQKKISAYNEQYRAWEDAGRQGEAPRLKTYSDMAGEEQRFASNIRKIVDTSEIPLTVRPNVRPADHRSKHIYLSGSNFLHLYDFAVALHARNMPEDTSAKAMEAKFNAMSLEYQLSGINRAKSFSRYLNALGCFYTDRPVDYAMVTSFTPEQAESIAPLEHERWVRTHRDMGWRCGTEYETLPIDPDGEAERVTLREQLRIHRSTMDGDPTSEEIRAHYYTLPEKEQDKDWKPLNSMLELLKKFDGLRIYHL